MGQIRGASTDRTVAAWVVLRDLGMPLRAAEDLLSVLTRRLGTTELELQFHRNPHPELWVIRETTLWRARYDTQVGPEVRFRLPEDAAASNIAALGMRDALDELKLVSINNVDFRWDDDAGAWSALEVAGLRRLSPTDYAPLTLNAPHAGATPEEILTGVAALWFLGKLADAYVSRLGEMLAESTVETVRRLRMKRNEPRTLTIVVPDDVTTIILPDALLPDEAKLALIDLNPAADGVRGQTLVWDSKAGAWVPRGGQGPQDELRQKHRSYHGDHRRKKWLTKVLRHRDTGPPGSP